MRPADVFVVFDNVDNVIVSVHPCEEYAKREKKKWDETEVIVRYVIGTLEMAQSWLKELNVI